MSELTKVGNNSDTSTTGINWEEIKRTATKPNEQKASNDIGIDANGNIINLDLWEYYEVDGTIKLRKWIR